MSSRKVLIIGLDCAPPELVFEAFRTRLPVLNRLMENGVYGRLRTVDPPITVPAWACFATGRNPGQLGFTGFRNRRKGTYDDLFIANSTIIREPTLWEILSRHGKRVGVVGVPQTYPVRPVNGFMVSCFLTPSIESPYTYPPALRDEIAAAIGRYILDVEEFRTEDKQHLLEQIYEMTETRFALVRHFLKTKPWDFFIMVEMGTDRIHHGLWKHYDRTHRKYEPGNPFEGAMEAYYRYIDGEIGRILELVDNETVVIVMSDHGAKRMDGCINVNDWLIQEGYLTLKSKPDGVVRLKHADIDWGKTTAWGWGGYYSRIFLNVRGREPQGIVSPAEYGRLRDELAAKLRAIPDDRGQPLDTRVLKPEEIYRGDRIDEAPDLLVYFGDLYWRATEDIGHDSIYSFETEIGPDDAVHDYEGIFIMYDPRQPGGGRELTGLHLLDGAPTVLSLMDLPIPAEMEGRVIGGVIHDHTAWRLSG